MNLNRLLIITFFILITNTLNAKENSKSNFSTTSLKQRGISLPKKILVIIGLTLISPRIGSANLNRHLGVIKKRRNSPFHPSPKEDCHILGEKKRLTYYIETTEGCPQPSDKANLIGPNIAAYIADLSAKWKSTDFVAVEEKELADFIIRLGDNSNSAKCPTTSYWSQGNREMGLGRIGVYGLLQRKQKRRTVLHEFGHVLGISHEHTHPDFPYTLDFDAIKSDSSNPGIHNYMPTDPEKSYLSDYDSKSLMHYKLAKKETTEGKKFKLNFKLSRGDHIAEFIAMPPCGLTSDEAYKIYLDLSKELAKTENIVSPEIFCEHLFLNLGVNSTGRCEFPEDRYLVLSKYAIIGISAAGGVLILWCTKRICCGENSATKPEKAMEPPPENDHDIV